MRPPLRMHLRAARVAVLPAIGTRFDCAAGGAAARRLVTFVRGDTRGARFRMNRPWASSHGYSRCEQRTQLNDFPSDSVH
jgi:hypothetical protein